MKDLNKNNRRKHYQSRKKQGRDYSFVIGCVIFALAFTALMLGMLRAYNIWEINTCDMYSDCEEVYSHLTI